MGDMNFSLTTFNKTGKLTQIENALARVQQGKMALGIKGKHLIPPKECSDCLSVLVVITV